MACSISSPRAARGERSADAVQQGPDLPVDHDRVQPFLAAEVLVHDRLADLGLRGDLLDRGALEAPVGEQSAGHADELLTALGAGHPDPARPTGPGGIAEVLGAGGHDVQSYQTVQSG